MAASATLSATMLFATVAFSIVAAQSTLKVTALRTEYKVNPLGIDQAKPRLSWQIQSSERNVVQSAYQIRVAMSERDLRSGTNLVWDSARVTSDESVHRVYAGPQLKSATRYAWQVKVWDGAGKSSDWSELAWWETGLMSPSDWKANWIEPDLKEDPKKSEPAPMLRRDFKVSSAVDSARIYITSHGLYQLRLNGAPVGDQVFTPGWTSYNKRLQYQTYDVTSLLTSGDNAVGIILGDGWYRGNIGFSNKRNVYGEHLALLFELRIKYRNGREESVLSDQTWKAATGPIVMSEIYHGETYDARLEKAGWDRAGFDARDWASVHVADLPRNVLIASEGPPVRKIQELKPTKIFKTPAGDTVVDIGQNMVGWVRLKAQGNAGTTITLRHAEVLDKQGNFYIENLRAAKQTVTYTMKGGGGPETYEPLFSFQGFRYVAVDGYPGTLTPESLTGIVIHSDMTPASQFETSKSLINQLQHNIIWGQKGNFLDVPTDCPQRDERLGWTGDAQVFARTAAFNTDTATFYTKWLKDMAADQFETGSVPHVIPNVLGPAGGSAAWADAAVIIPWTMYLCYRDTRILEVQYDSMRKWVEFERKQAGDDYVWDGGQHFGDWLAFATTRSDYPGATTSKDLIATAFYAYSTGLLAQAAEVLGRADDAMKYRDLFEKVKAAFQKEYVTSTGRVGENTQTAYVLALHFDLLPEDMRIAAAKRLAQEVRERKHLTTGFVGTPYLCHVLSRYGYLDEAYLLLNREDYPGWLYPVKQGATTIWERWDGQKPDGSFQDKGMNSFNHYAYGAVGDWMYRVTAGIEIDPKAPGYKHILIQPRPGGGFTSVKASHDSIYGKVSSSWTLADGRFDLTVEVPPNTKATVRLPLAQAASISEPGARQDGSDVVVDVGSGNYRFSYAMTK